MSTFSPRRSSAARNSGRGTARSTMPRGAAAFGTTRRGTPDRRVRFRESARTHHAADGRDHHREVRLVGPEPLAARRRDGVVAGTLAVRRLLPFGPDPAL